MSMYKLLYIIAPYVVSNLCTCNTLFVLFIPSGNIMLVSDPYESLKGLF